MDGVENVQVKKALQRTRETWLKLIEANIRRLSELELPEHGLLINLATYTLYGIYHDHIQHQQKVIIGKPRSPTPLLSCQMDAITFRPAWGVPPKIFLNTIRGRVMGNPEYLERNGFVVCDRDGSPVDPAYIAWDSLSPRYFPYQIRQQPGANNSLGHIRFHLNNKDNIHLHDTPKKNLFQKDARAFSAGCVRLEKADKLAEWLGFPFEDDTPGQHITFEKAVPVVMAYVTLWFDGDTLFVSDPYKRDAI